MEKDNLFDSFQNTVVSAIALHAFVLGFHSVAKHKSNKLNFPPLPYLFFVLPIVYNYRAMEVFNSAHQLYMVLQKEKSISLGLQERALKMTNATFEALNLAFSKYVLSMDNETGVVMLTNGFKTKRLALPLSMNTSDNRVKQIRDCAFRVGGIFAKRSINNIQFELNISI